METKVRLRIAGIYYDEKFELGALPPVPAIAIPGRTAPAGPTIFELLEAAVNKECDRTCGVRIEKTGSVGNWPSCNAMRVQQTV